jgi:hypothetical protein
MRLRLFFFFGLPLVGCVHATEAPQTGEEDSTAALSCDVRDFGAKGDGVTKDTAAIQAAIDACADKGGEVHLRQGTYLSGMIQLKSAMTFHVHGGATLLGSQDDADYPDTKPPTNNSQLHNCKRALVYAESVHDLHVTGTGTIDGNGVIAKWMDANVAEAQRPMAIFFVLSQNVTIESITVKNSAMWSVVNMEADNLVVRGITVDSTKGRTRDGIDVVDGQHVLIDGVTVSSEDDSICLKSGVARGLDDVTVKNSHVLQSGVANGLKLGTASVGAFTNITFDTIDVVKVDKAGLAVESVDGAKIQNVVFRNITLHDVGTPFFVLLGNRGIKPPRTVGSIDGVRFESVTADFVRHDWGSIVSGLPTFRVTNVTFQDVHVTMMGGLAAAPAEPAEYAGQYPDPNLWNEVPAYGLFLRHTDNVSFVRTTIDVAGADARTQIHTSDVTNLTPPQCDVTFIVHAPPAPATGEAVRVLGRTSLPLGIDVPLAADPLGAWKAAATTAVLTPAGGDAYTGHASLPQGASLDFKTVITDGTQTTYERNHLGNRQAAVPNAATATIEFDWQN